MSSSQIVLQMEATVTLHASSSLMNFHKTANHLEINEDQLKLHNPFLAMDK